VRKKADRLTKIICILVVGKVAMMSELLKIQQDMGAPRQEQRRKQTVGCDEDQADILADPDDWVADLPKFGIYHRGYTTNHWLQVFRPR
tara:strand:- start:421 stop:687 length:267 start_codon:yes stop_codon:yes gene_type:complete